MRYLTGEEILFIHSAVLDESGGTHGVRDLDLIASLEVLPQQSIGGQELYPTVFLKAALYARNLITSHPFLDGNKRVGMTAAIVFLGHNNFVFTGEKGSIEHFALKIVNEKLSLEEIAAWLEKPSHPVKKNS